ncbi:MAG: hypothetical protein ACR2LE_08415 [Nocardioidaceae bacterium]
MTTAGMSELRRWCAVTFGVVVLVSIPVALQARPAHEVGSSATELLAQATSSTSVPYSGYVESRGTLQLPISDQFTDVADLLGGKTTMRVWWRSADLWRVDSLDVTGETDLYHSRTQTTSWDYEHNRASLSKHVDVRLPQSADLLPPELARRLLEDVTAAEVRPIAPTRVAGVDAQGLRLTPSAHQSSIDHVDLWLEPSTGLPVKVAVFGDGQTTAAVETAFVDLDLSEPSLSQTTLTLSPSAELERDDIVDIAAAANRYSPLAAPRSLAGLDRRRDGLGAVGLYGEGATLLVAIPLWDHAAVPLRDQLHSTPGAVETPIGTRLAASPLNLVLTTPEFENGSWLLAGTVTPQALRRAAAHIASHPVRFRRQFRQP